MVSAIVLIFVTLKGGKCLIYPFAFYFKTTNSYHLIRVCHEQKSTIFTDRNGFTANLILDATGDTIRYSLHKVAQMASENDSILIYYSGYIYRSEHIFYSTNEDLFLIPVDVNMDNIVYRAISINEIKWIFETSQFKNLLLIVDSVPFNQVNITSSGRCLQKLYPNEKNGTLIVISSEDGNHYAQYRLDTFTNKLIEILKDNTKPLINIIEIIRRIECCRIPPNRRITVESGTFILNSANEIIPIIHVYIKKHFADRATLLDKKPYKLQYIVSDIKNEILVGSNHWERIQLHIYLTEKNMFDIIIDASSAPGLGNKEPQNSSYEDMEKNHSIELIEYTKRLRTEIENYITQYQNNK